jgi:ribosomal protein RSM22 (predicted rRNA methylase)
VIVDHGNPWGSHQVRSARQFVLDTINEQEGDGDEDDDEEGEKAASETRDSVRIVAPCPHQHEVRQAYLCTVASWIPVG